MGRAPAARAAPHFSVACASRFCTVATAASTAGRVLGEQAGTAAGFGVAGLWVGEDTERQLGRLVAADDALQVTVGHHSARRGGRSRRSAAYHQLGSKLMPSCSRRLDFARSQGLQFRSLPMSLPRD